MKISLHSARNIHIVSCNILLLPSGRLHGNMTSHEAAWLWYSDMRRGAGSFLLLDATSRLYTVEMLLVVDFAIFERWYELAPRGNYQERQEYAINNIRYYFAHVANGVQLISYLILYRLRQF